MNAPWAGSIAGADLCLQESMGDTGGCCGRRLSPPETEKAACRAAIGSHTKKTHKSTGHRSPACLSFFQSLRSIDGILARCTVLDSGSTSSEHTWIAALLDLYVMLGGGDNQQASKSVVCQMAMEKDHGRK